MNMFNGKIDVYPKTVYWVKMPKSISEEDKIELLKKDLFLVNCNNFSENLVKVKDSNDKYSMFFYNFDEILKTNKLEYEQMNDFLYRFVEFIKSIGIEKSIVHSMTINEKLANYFKRKNIFYLEKNLYDKKTAISTILTAVYNMFSNPQNGHRSQVRLNITSMNYEVTLSDKKNKKILMGTLKDISLNGFGIILRDKKAFDSMKLKKIIEAEVKIHNNRIKISNAIVSRKNTEENEIGINFNINDSVMVDKKYASFLTEVVYNWLKHLIKDYSNKDMVKYRF